MAKVRFICAKCGKESWFRVHLDTYVITALDLICDDCNPIEEEKLTEEEYALATLGQDNPQPYEEYLKEA